MKKGKKPGIAVVLAVVGLVAVLGVCVWYGIQYGKTPSQTVVGDGEVVQISLKQNGSTVSGVGVSVSGNVVAIGEGGNYRMSGTLKEGQIYVNVGSNETVVLTLGGVDITNLLDAAIHVENAGNTILLLEEGTENRVQSGEERSIVAAEDEDDQNVDQNATGAAIYAKDDLSIMGSGSLQVFGYLNNGIHTKNNLVIESGNIEVQALNNGIKGKDSVTIKGGNLSILSGGDGIKADDTTGEGYGVILVEGGNLSIESGGDGIQAETDLTISGGAFQIAAGGGSGSMLLPRGEDGSVPSMPQGEGGNIPTLPQEEGGDMPIPPQGEGRGMSVMPEGGDMPTPPQGEGGDMPAMPQGGGGNMPTPPQGESEGGDMSMMPQGEGNLSSLAQGGGGDPSSRQQRGGRDPFSGSPGGNGDTPFGSGRGGGGMQGGWGNQNSNWDLSDMGQTSAKGLKSGRTLTITGGTFQIDSYDDAIHSNGTILISGGSFVLATGDDGVHGDVELRITDGDLQIVESYEGLEANQISLEGGSMSIVASDDGINANGGTSIGWGWGGRGGFAGNGSTAGGGSSASTGSGEELPSLTISGGTVKVDAKGDGLDSNGSILITGGEITVDGPSDSMNGAIDSGTENGGICSISGGTILAVGSSGMAEGFSGSSEQCSFLYSLGSTFAAGSEIVISDADGNELCRHTAVRSGGSVVFSSPELVLGETYILSVNDQRAEITLDSVSVSNGRRGWGWGW